jgi:hypothetical protein
VTRGFHQYQRDDHRDDGEDAAAREEGPAPGLRPLLGPLLRRDPLPGAFLPVPDCFAHGLPLDSMAAAISTIYVHR